MLVMEAIALIRREHTSSKGKTIRETAEAGGKGFRSTRDCSALRNETSVSTVQTNLAWRSGSNPARAFSWSRKSTDRKSMFLPLGGSD